MSQKRNSNKNTSNERTADGQGALGVLVSAMEHDAGQEAQKIVSEARKEAERKHLYADRQVESITEEARKNADVRAELIRQQELSGVTIEIKRMTMKIQEEVYGEVLQRALHNIRQRIEGGGYKKVLLSHIVEAAVGLDAPSASINASEHEREMISGELIREAENKVTALTGKATTLSLSDQPPLRKPGVVLTSEDNRTAYDNSIHARMIRKSARIRQFIYDSLFDV
jgi:vacuolar-type H+-ATPase subunit E/Vma4